MQNKLEPISPVDVLDELKKTVCNDIWVNRSARRHVISGIELCIHRLQTQGFLRTTEDELSITPIVTDDRPEIFAHSDEVNNG